MRTIKALIAAAAVAVTVLVPASSANATQCTPKGCSGGCKPPHVQIDEDGTIRYRLIECYN